LTVLAVTEWPEAMIAIAGIAMVTVIVGIATWQIFATGRSGLVARREGQYKQLVEELSTVQRETTAELQKANDALAQLRAQVQDLEQSLEEVDRVLKTVE
jgi:outer membrane protein TolC